ncbi:hypothetical protein H1O05_gp12 [Klebsiella phage Sweeny]|uniref:Uncharacterized protein n=1 Tax=Klebsiella phage Sweeny TaxID=2580408 RepID=A0A5B9N0I8_9CAUD|nr:hypothetical protein H1O05_gp12 [Klebsiella phage Sweeny]QEG07117.1 hypothetical protein CPT_Sweeny_012 [Klebsiella phage Sweeny]
MIRLSDFDHHCLTGQFGEKPVMCKISKVKGDHIEQVNTLRGLAMRNRLYIQARSGLFAKQVHFAYGTGFYTGGDGVNPAPKKVKPREIIEHGYVWTNGIY